MPIKRISQLSQAKLSGKIQKRRRFATAAISLISVVFVMGTLIPAIARASVLSAIIATFTGNVANAEVATGSGTLQSSAALKPAMNIDPAPAQGGGDITIVDGSALVPEEGPSGTLADIEKPKSAIISIHVVREGDTVASIAKLYDVTPNTVLWANDLAKGAALKVGQTLTILPVPGVKYTVKRGDTLESIVKKYGGDKIEIMNRNGLESEKLAAGTEIIIPDGELRTVAPKPTKSTGTTNVAIKSGPRGTAIQVGYYRAPLSSYTETQGVHGYNGVDLAAPVGTPIMASAEGDVIVAKSGGYNGGYGTYVVIQHDNGSQTLYAHMSRISTYSGEHVQAGSVIGYVGLTGKTTGAHVHFEIRNGIRNPF